MISAAASPYLASIHISPLKACRAADLDESQVEPWGLAGDRRWLVVDGAGRFVSQRDEPALARVTARYFAASGPDHTPGSCPVSTGLIAVSAAAEGSRAFAESGRRDAV